MKTDFQYQLMLLFHPRTTWLFLRWIFQLQTEALEASWCGWGRNRRKATFGCQSLLLKQIGNRSLAYCAKHLLRTYCDLESRSNCSIIVTADEKQLASIWILIWNNIDRKSFFPKGISLPPCCPVPLGQRGPLVAPAPLIAANLLKMFWGTRPWSPVSRSLALWSVELAKELGLL